MKKSSLALSLLCLMGLIFLAAPTLAQSVDDRGVDEEVAPPEKTAPPVAPPPAPAPKAAWGGRWPWTSERPIQSADLEPLSLGELELMRNEIYARHGWIFRRPDLRNYFESQPWYRPKSDNAYYSNRQVEAELSPIERRNLQIIISRENALKR
jgi:YARHG domain